MEIELAVDVQAVGSEVRGVFSFLTPLHQDSSVLKPGVKEGTWGQETGLSKRSKG